MFPADSCSFGKGMQTSLIGQRNFMIYDMIYGRRQSGEFPGPERLGFHYYDGIALLPDPAPSAASL